MNSKENIKKIVALSEELEKTNNVIQELADLIAGNPGSLLITVSRTLDPDNIVELPTKDKQVVQGVVNKLVEQHDNLADEISKISGALHIRPKEVISMAPHKWDKMKPEDLAEEISKYQDAPTSTEKEAIEPGMLKRKLNPNPNEWDTEKEKPNIGYGWDPDKKDKRVVDAKGE